MATLSRSVPQGFDDGLAVPVSDKRRYVAPVSAGDRSWSEPDGDLPDLADRTAFDTLAT